MIGLAMMLSLADDGVPGFKTGNEVLEMCSQPMRSECIGYVEAVADMNNVLPVLNIRTVKACFSDQVTSGQLADVAVKFLRQNPELRDQGGAGLTWLAFSKAFPCPKP